MNDTTIGEAVILAAYRRQSINPSKATVETLALDVWSDDKQRFGLRGFATEHPDPRPIACALMGRRGLVARGLFTLSSGLYSLTDSGRAVARRLLGETAPETAQERGEGGNGRKGGEKGDRAAAGLPEATDADLRLMLESGAWWRWRADKSSISFGDACFFWGLVEGADSVARLEHVKTVVRTAMAAVSVAPGVVLSDGRELTVADADNLACLHAYLINRFRPHLRLLGTRKAAGV